MLLLHLLVIEGAVTAVTCPRGGLPKRPDIEWTCPTCALPPQLSDSFFAEVLEGELAEINVLERDREKVTQENVAERSFGEEDEDIISDNAQFELLRKHHSKDLLLAHLNINSVQNKFEELSAIIKTLRAHIIFISETKIDASYPNAQFSIPGYSLYRNDRKKGGGGIMALISTSFIKTRLKPAKNYKALELFAFEIKTDTGNNYGNYWHLPPSETNVR